MYTWYIQILETKSKGNSTIPEDSVPTSIRLGVTEPQILTHINYSGCRIHSMDFYL